MIQLKEVNIGYTKKGKQELLVSNISFSISEGEVIALLGPNGSGKSTLLKSIIGTIPLLSGEVLIESINLKEVESFEKAKLVSIVTTERVGGFNLTVRDFVSFGRYPYLSNSKELNANDEKIVLSAIKAVDIQDILDKDLQEISDGQYQKCAIARALAQDTKLILMDEPNAFLDFKMQNELFGLIKRMAKENNKSIILSTHAIDKIKNLADKVILLDRQLGFEFTQISDLDNSKIFNEMTG
ncbi:MAG: ABC transporter ATP-binding protein [Bacteroidia bacterium]